MGPGGDDVLRHLLAISRDFEPRLLDAVRERGFQALRPSYARFLYVVWDEPQPLHAIAAELGISNQATSQIAGHLEASGYVERRANPADKRSKLIVIRPDRRVVEDARINEAIQKCEARYAAMIGAPALDSCVASLSRLRDSFGVRAAVSAFRPSLGTLPLVALEARDRAVKSLVGRGHSHLKPSHFDVYGFVGRSGARPVEVAGLLGVSRQAASSALLELEQLGYLQRRRATADLRGVVFTPTPRGETLLDDDAAVGAELAGSFEQVLGRRDFDRLKRAAGGLFRALQAEMAPSLAELAARLRETLGAVDAARLATLLTG